MGQTEATRQSDFITPPTAGQISAYTTGSATSQDLRLIGTQPANMAVPNTTGGAVGHYLSLEADTNDVYVIFGATQASVTGANAPVAGATGTNGTGVCWRIVAGTVQHFKLEAGRHLWLGYMSSTAGTLRIYQSSP